MAQAKSDLLIEKLGRNEILADNGGEGGRPWKLNSQRRCTVLVAGHTLAVSLRSPLPLA